MEGKEYRAKDGYRDVKTASDYDLRRYVSLHGRLKNWTKKRAIAKGLSFIGPIRTVVDIPCGTGRFCDLLSERGLGVIGADISHEMMMVSKNKSAPYPNHLGYVQCDGENIPLRNESVDCVLSIRFTFHLPPEVRKNVLSEIYRITRRWVIVDFRYASFKSFVRKSGTFLGIGKDKKRSDLGMISKELSEAGLRIRRIIHVLPLFSEKVVFVCERDPIRKDGNR